jgi:hypothetical protein
VRGICLFPQVRQPFFHGLDLEPEFRQVSLQLGDLLGLGQVTAFEVLTFAAAITATIARAAAVTGSVLAITLFIHINSPLDISSIYASS